MLSLLYRLTDSIEANWSLDRERPRVFVRGTPSAKLVEGRQPKQQTGLPCKTMISDGKQIKWLVRCARRDFEKRANS